MDCPNCGAYNASSSTHCRRCGHPLPVDETGETDQDEWTSDLGSEENWTEQQWEEESVSPWSSAEPEQQPGSLWTEQQETSSTGYEPPAGEPSTATTPGYFGAPGIPNYLWPSIGATLCCCAPLGIPAIIYASRVDAYLKNSDRDAAQHASDRARTWLIASVAVALLIWIAIFCTGYFEEGSPTV